MQIVKMTKALLDAGADTNIPGIDTIRLEKIRNGEICDEDENEGNEEDENENEEDLADDDQPVETSRDLINQLMEKKLSRRSDLHTAEIFQAVIENRSTELPDLLTDIDINITAFDDETLLHAAVANHSVESIKILLDHEINVNAKTAIVQESPLHLAVQENMLDVIQILLDKEADIESTNIGYETPLYTAIRFGRKESLILLLERNAQVNVVNSEGITPLIVAIQLHRKELAVEILKKNPDLMMGELNPFEVSQNSGELELFDIITQINPDLANANKPVRSRPSSRIMKQPIGAPIFDAIKSRNQNLLRRLLSKPTELNINDPKYGIPLFKAIESGSLECVRLLLSAGSDIQFKDNKTAIEYAIECHQKEIVEFFIDEGVDLNETDKNNEGPIFYAVRSKDPDMVNLLASNGSSVNVINSSNMSPLYVAIGIKQKEIVELLLQYQADPNNTGLPCLRLAKQMKDDQLIKILTKGGAAITMQRTAHTNRVRSQLQSRNDPIKARKLPPPRDGECMICKSKTDLVKLIPCGHQLTCKNCMNIFAEKFSTCPICKVSLFAAKSD
ncbi:hypothetical protein M9Y10_012384 [Tritrichomonas musculus]|uniref:RING-type domain-containing protein n=1 Tax=Tritrichomonas musculus TaxID=1915356 RepID=A0ABR2IDJ7_9EUKA